MASNTENLNLLMKNPSTDGADTFNIQTMLNENWQKIDNNAGTVAQTLANILKPTTPPIIGLPPSTTPDGMFQALGNTGELHVWRKTVTTTQEVPGGYTLGDALNDVFLVQNKNSTSYVIAYVYLATSISANDDGVISADWGNRRTLSYNGEFVVNGPMYMKIDSVHANSTSDFDVGDIVFIPSGYSTRKMSGSSGYSIYFDRCQKVNPYPKIPAGTTTTYPVSTNPNAYQEGDDAKEAGYTLGEVVTGSFRAGATNYTISYGYEAASELTVSDDGRTVSMTSPSAGSFGFMGGLEPGDNPAKIRAFMLGKFVRCTTKGDQLNEAPDTKYPFNTIPSDIVYIPSNAQITIANGDVLVDRYQPVTGYAAIPAGTTIEYLGKLGDKARVQVMSYVGTGTYGSSNPNSLTFDFVPKVVIISKITADSAPWALFLPPILSGTYSRRAYNITGVTTKQTDSFAKINKKTLSWFSTDGFTPQLNSQSDKYTAIAIG